MARLPEKVQALLDRLEPEIRDAFLEAIDQVTNAAQLNSFIAALEANDLDAAVAALRIETPFFAPVDRAIGNAFASAATAALTDLRLKDPNSGDAFLLGFDGRHTRAERWVRDRSSGLIVEIVEQQREMAREVIETGLAGGQNPRQVALDIVGRMNKETGKREGGFIGLTSQQAQWAKNAEKELRNLDSAYFQRKRRDKRFDGTIKKAIESGQPIPEADLRRIVTRYRDRLKKYRGDTIGRTEALNSMRSGQHEGFAQLVDSGQVRADQIEVGWGATMDARTRDSHRYMNGRKVKFGELFEVAPGVRMEYPGDLEHSTDPKRLAAESIQCRCLATYRVRSDLMRSPDSDGKPAPIPPPPVVPRAPDPAPAKGRSAVEQLFLAELDMQGDAAGAFMATKPPRFLPDEKGFYVPGDHTIRQRISTRDRKGEFEHQGRKWIGTFAHEYGHAVDYDGFGMDDLPRSARMVPGMALDRADLIAGRTGGMVSNAMRQTAAEIGGDDAAGRFADLWQAGNVTEALGELINGIGTQFEARAYKTTRDMFVDHYSLYGVLDFIGAVSDLEKGQGHSKGYYRQFKIYADQAEFFTTGHSTEAFANAFMAHTLPRRDFLMALVEQAAPRTIAAFRSVLKERARDAAINR